MKGKQSAGQESSDLSQPPSFGERYLFKRNEGHGMYAQDIPSSLDNTEAADDTINMSSLATIEREIRDKMAFKEQKIKEIE